MAATYYGSNRPMTLQDLLAHANSQPDAPVATPLPPDASQVDIPGATSPQDRQKLLDMLMAPDDVGPAPAVDKPNAMSLIFTGLGDAMNAMVAGQTGNPGMRSDAMGQYLRTIESQKQDLRDYQQRKGMAHNVSKNRTAQYLLSEMDRKDNRALMAADRAAAAKEAETLRRDQMTQHASEVAAAAVARKQEFEAKKSWDLEMEKARFGHEQAVAGIRAKVTEGDKAAAQDQKNLGEIIGYIGGLADVADVALAGGDPARQIPAMTPEQMATKVRRLMDQMQLGPEARKAVETYFQKEMGPIIKKAELDRKNQAAIDTPTNGPGILDSSPIPMNSALALGR